MVGIELTQEFITSGERLIKKLEQRGMAPDVVFWLYSSEDQAWKLVLVEEKLSKEGPRAGYLRLQRVLSQHGSELQPLELKDVEIAKSTSRIVQLIKKAVRTKNKAVRFRNNVLDGTLIDDAYIYRTRKSA